MIEPLEHVMVVSAMSRLARHGGWARLLEGKPLENELDLVDAELLVEARVLHRHPDDSLELVHAHPWHYEPESLAAGTLALLRQAVRHAEGRATGWSGDDPDAVLAQGLVSTSTATVVGESLLPQLDGSHAAFTSGPATMLDVGVGIAAFSSKMCQLYPRLRCTGIDVLEPVLESARQRVAAAGLAERIDLRWQSVADLSESECYDLAWVPQAFIPPAALRPGLAAVREALRPGRWLVLLLAAASREADAFQRAVQVHGAHITGGGPVDPADVVVQLEQMGFDRVREVCSGDQSMLVARRAG